MRALKVLVTALIALAAVLGGVLVTAAVVVFGFALAGWRRLQGRPPMGAAPRPRAPVSRRPMKRIDAQDVTVADVSRPVLVERADERT